MLPPLKDSSSEELPALGYAHLPLPSVDNSVMPELVWVPPLPQPTGRIVDGEVLVPRWRLAREGLFLAERSPESYLFLGSGLRLPEHYLPCVRLYGTGGGLRPSPAPPAIRGVDRSPAVRRTDRAQRETVGQQTFARSGYHSCCPSATQCGAHAD